MNITPLIPDGYNGPIKQLTCRICKHIFYLTMADYSRLAEVAYCHECSLILIEELSKSQGSPSKIPPAPSPVSLAPLPQTEPVAPRLSVRVPQSRTIDRHKMTVEQLLEEAQMLDKTWRYKEALASYESTPARPSMSGRPVWQRGNARQTRSLQRGVSGL